MRSCVLILLKLSIWINDSFKYPVWSRLCCAKITSNWEQKLLKRVKLATKNFAATGLSYSRQNRGKLRFVATEPSNSWQTHVKRVNAFSAKFYTRIHPYSCKTYIASNEVMSSNLAKTKHLELFY
jgi:hypothetical protein